MYLKISYFIITKIMLAMLASFNLFRKINFYKINFILFTIGFISLDFFEFCLNLACIHTCAKCEFRGVFLRK